jgi:hypothetical protein
MERLVQGGKTYSYYDYGREQEFEQIIVQHAPHWLKFVVSGLSFRRCLRRGNLSFANK